MIRHAAAERLRALPGADVAPVTIRVRDSKRIVVPHVAISAGYDFPGRLQLVRTGEWPACRAVIKLRTQPTVERMAGFAGGGKLRADVVGILGLLIII